MSLKVGREKPPAPQEREGEFIAELQQACDCSMLLLLLQSGQHVAAGCLRVVGDESPDGNHTPPFNREHLGKGSTLVQFPKSLDCSFHVLCPRSQLTNSKEPSAFCSCWCCTCLLWLPLLQLQLLLPFSQVLLRFKLPYDGYILSSRLGSSW